ncbi:MAG TPA: YkvA family protein, partial [Gemmatimonadaceae bacterium]|nr:YkvA family protein [Gemmatimonadaceae bacterium]
TERATAKRTLTGTIRQIPAYLKLLGGLLTDARVSRVDKLMVVGAIVYIVTPIDLIPDFIPFVGQVDDVYLLVLSLTRLISNAGLPVLSAHWAGDISDLTPGRLRSVLLAASLFLPRGIRRRLRRRR